MQCERCGAVQESGSGYCRICAAPLSRSDAARSTPVAAPPAPVRRSRWLTGVALASIAFLLLVCLTLASLAFGLSSLIRWT
jgi:hypothetical protein